MEAITKGQIKRLHTLLQKAGMMEVKRDLILHYTNGRTNSAKELRHQEADEIIEHLLENDPRQRMIKKVYALAYEIGIAYSGDEIDRKLNKVSIDQWLIKYSYLKKRLDQYTAEELPKLCSQLMQVSKHNQQSKLNKQAARSVDDLLNELGIPN